MHAHVLEVHRDEIELLGGLDLVALDAETAVAGHHGDLVHLLRAHRRDDVDRPFVDGRAEVHGAGDVAGEDVVETLAGQEIGDRGDRPLVLRRRRNRMHAA